MAKLTALHAPAHAGLKLSPARGLIYARGAHMLPLRVTEVARAITDFPVVISRLANGDLSLSALTSFEVDQNLFVVGEQWDSSFQSTAMQTSPLYLMRDEAGGPEPVLGLDESSEALVKDEGHRLLDKKGRPSLWAKQIKAQLLDDSQNMMLTMQFFDALKSLNLIRDVDIILNFEDEQTNRIRGLSMIHEDNLKALPAPQFEKLRQIGFFAPIQAMLFSVFQLNSLIRRHNRVNTARVIKTINLEITKDLNSA